MLTGPKLQGFIQEFSLGGGKLSKKEQQQKKTHSTSCIHFIVSLSKCLRGGGGGVQPSGGKLKG